MALGTALLQLQERAMAMMSGLSNPEVPLAKLHSSAQMSCGIMKQMTRALDCQHRPGACWSIPPYILSPLSVSFNCCPTCPVRAAAGAAGQGQRGPAAARGPDGGGQPVRGGGSP